MVRIGRRNTRNEDIEWARNQFLREDVGRLQEGALEYRAPDWADLEWARNEFLREDGAAVSMQDTNHYPNIEDLIREEYDFRNLEEASWEIEPELNRIAAKVESFFGKVAGVEEVVGEVNDVLVEMGATSDDEYYEDYDEDYDEYDDRELEDWHEFFLLNEDSD